MFDKFSFVGIFWFRISLKCSRTFSSNNRSFGNIQGKADNQTQPPWPSLFRFKFNSNGLKKIEFLNFDTSRFGIKNGSTHGPWVRNRKTWVTWCNMTKRFWRISILFLLKFEFSEFIWLNFDPAIFSHSRSLTFDFNFWVQMGLRLEIVRQVWNQPWFICCLFCSQLFQFSL